MTGGYREARRSRVAAQGTILRLGAEIAALDTKHAATAAALVIVDQACLRTAQSDYDSDFCALESRLRSA